jgi:hypothetical protein
MYAAFLCKMLFSGFEPMTSWSQRNSFTAAPGLPFKDSPKKTDTPEVIIHIYTAYTLMKCNPSLIN